MTLNAKELIDLTENIDKECLEFSKWCLKNIKAKAKDLDFISWIKRDGSGTEPVPDDMLESMLNNKFSKDDKYKLNVLSLRNKTFIASGFNSFVVKLKNK